MVNIDSIKKKKADKTKLNEPIVLPKGPSTKVGQSLASKAQKKLSSIDKSNRGIQRNKDLPKAQKGEPRISGQATSLDPNSRVTTPSSRVSAATTEEETPLAPLTDEERAQQLKDQSKSLFEFDEFVGPQDFATELGFKDDLFASSLEDFLEKQKGLQEEERKFLEGQQRIQQQMESDQLRQASAQTEAQISGVEASLAPGREGFVAGTAPAAIDQFEASVTAQMSLLRGKASLAKNVRNKAMADLKKAQDSGNKELVKQIQARIAGAEQDIIQAETNLISAQAKAAEVSMQMQDQTRINTESKIETLEAMGSSIAGLSSSQLSQIIQGTNLTMPEALTLQKAIELEGLAANAKTVAEAEKLSLQADELRASIPNVGKTTSQLEFEFFDTLSPSDQATFMDLKRADPNLQFYKNDDGSVISVNPKTGQAQTVFSAPSSVGDLGIVQRSGLDVNDVPGGGGSNAILDYVAFYPGSSSNLNGPDFTAPKGTPIKAHFGGEVISVTTGEVPTAGASGWGNQIRVVDGEGNVHQYSHLSDVGVEVGDVLDIGQFMGKVGNTGNVLAGDGSTLSQSQIESGRGSHLDYSVYKPDGSIYSLGEAYQFATGTGSNAASAPLLNEKEARSLNKEMLKTDEYKSLDKSAVALNALLEFEQAWINAGEGVQLFGADVGELNSKYNTALLNMKEFFNLGVLNGPDLDLMKTIIPDPTSFGTGFSGVIGRGGSQAVTDGIENIKGQLGEAIESRYSQLLSLYGENQDQLSAFEALQPRLEVASNSLALDSDELGPEAPATQSDLSDPGYWEQQLNYSKFGIE